MNVLHNIVDVTDESFRVSVVERSHEVPVLVDYWADWCGPCRMQMPVLQKLVDDYAGKFTLARVNTDEQHELARLHNIRSLPTMRLYRHGEVVEDIAGAQTEGTLRILLDRYIERPSDRLRAQARELVAHGEHAQALALLEQAHRDEPDNHQLALDYAEACHRAGRHEQARTLVESLPLDVRHESEAKRLAALIDFADSAPAAESLEALEDAVSASPDDLEQRFRLGNAYVAGARYEEALATFMHILERDRGFRDDGARKAILAIFELLGDDSELVADWRRRLFTALH